MGGFGSGGSRSGAGRKKKASHLRGIDGGAGRRPSSDGDAVPPAAVDDRQMLPAPDDVAGEVLMVWNKWAPRAHASGTLTAETVDNFVLLCLAEADRRELYRRYTGVRTGPNGELLPLIYINHEEDLSLRREHRTLLKDIHARMKDFKIAPFGKEILQPGAEAEADPLDAFTRKRG